MAKIDKPTAMPPRCYPARLQHVVVASPNMRAMTTTKKLPAAASPAWEAYQAMDQSKQAHFKFLRQLEQKYQNGGSRTLAETVHLEQLLQAHSVRVATFVEATRVLKESNRTAHQALVEQLASLNARLGESQEIH